MKPKCRICKTECPERRFHWNKLCSDCLPIWNQQWRLLKIPEDRRCELPWHEREKCRPKWGRVVNYNWASTSEVLQQRYRHSIDVLIIVKKVKRYGKAKN